MNKINDFIMEFKIIEVALQSLKSKSRIEGKWFKAESRKDLGIDGSMCLNVNNQELCWQVEVKKEIRPYKLPEIINAAKKLKNYMLVAYHIPEKIKEALRFEEVNYLDVAGNIYFKHGVNWLWIDGQKMQEEERERPNRAFTKAGLKVLFVLLNVENALDLTYRELARKSKVALGNIPLVLTGLIESGYLIKLNDKKYILNNKDELLHRWIDGYGELLKPSLFMGRFRFLYKDVNWEQLKVHEDDCWGGEAGAAKIKNNLNAELLTLYTKRSKSDVIKEFRLVPDHNGNVELYQHFWEKSLQVIRKDCAPLILIYADLILNKDPRNLEIAKSLENINSKEMINYT